MKWLLCLLVATGMIACSGSKNDPPQIPEQFRGKWVSVCGGETDYYWEVSADKLSQWEATYSDKECKNLTNLKEYNSLPVNSVEIVSDQHIKIVSVKKFSKDGFQADVQMNLDLVLGENTIRFDFHGVKVAVNQKSQENDMDFSLTYYREGHLPGTSLPETSSKAKSLETAEASKTAKKDVEKTETQLPRCDKKVGYAYTKLKSLFSITEGFNMNRARVIECTRFREKYRWVDCRTADDDFIGKDWRKKCLPY